MLIGAGMDSIRAVRSPCGVVAGMVVVVWCGAGCTALIWGLDGWAGTSGAGRASGALASSMSVSLGGPGRVYEVCLVSTVIFVRTHCCTV
jgi:hypothetical protein